MKIDEYLAGTFKTPNGGISFCTMTPEGKRSLQYANEGHSRLYRINKRNRTDTFKTDFEDGYILEKNGWESEDIYLHKIVRRGKK